MKVVILAGGLTKRLDEENEAKPKPMIPVAEKPILWHLMKYFSAFELQEFFIASGSKSDDIKRYFMNYHATSGSVMVDLETGTVRPYTPPPEQWKVHIVETGIHSSTGSRIKQLEPLLKDEEFFLATYGDGLADVDIAALIEFHKSHGKTATITAVRPPARFGAISFENNRVVHFSEKPQAEEGWINGGFWIFNREVFDSLEIHSGPIEQTGLEKLVAKGELMVFQHAGFWQCLDTVRDKVYLEGLWKNEEAPWKIWS